MWIILHATQLRLHPTPQPLQSKNDEVTVMFPISGKVIDYHYKAREMMARLVTSTHSENQQSMGAECFV